MFDEKHDSVDFQAEFLHANTDISLVTRGSKKCQDKTRVLTQTKRR